MIYRVFLLCFYASVAANLSFAFGLRKVTFSVVDLFSNLLQVVTGRVDNTVDLIIFSISRKDSVERFAGTCSRIADSCQNLRSLACTVCIRANESKMQLDRVRSFQSLSDAKGDRFLLILILYNARPDDSNGRIFISEATLIETIIIVHAIRKRTRPLPRSLEKVVIGGRAYGSPVATMTMITKLHADQRTKARYTERERNRSSVRI